MSYCTLPSIARRRGGEEGELRGVLAWCGDNGFSTSTGTCKRCKSSKQQRHGWDFTYPWDATARERRLEAEKPASVSARLALPSGVRTVQYCMGLYILYILYTLYTLYMLYSSTTYVAAPMRLLRTRTGLAWPGLALLNRLGGNGDVS